ncbi:histidine phosphatase family protein [Geitlerinema sp. CS-897]|nr:histidine phosphatase family protein [Geitlerinema sp. CS-897]
MEDRPLATTVILIRHGQSTYNLEGRIQGRCDKSVLTELGRETARQTGRALAGISFDAVYCSPLQRASQTAGIICQTLSEDGSLTPTVSDLLREVDLPLWEDRRRDEVMETFPDDYRLWKARPHEFKMVVPTEDGGTRDHFPILSLHEQAKQFWEFVLSKHAGQTVAVVAHNGINRCSISTALGVGPQDYQGIQQSNCGISIFRFSGGLSDTVQMESMNQIGHLSDDPFPSPRKPHRGPRLLLVRHGETQWNRESRFQGQIDVPLNENGRAQGRRVAQLLKSVKLDFAVTSPMLRPKETAELILEHHPGVPLTTNENLREIGHGLWEGKLESEIRGEYGELLERWKTQPETVQMPEGENLQQVWDRAKLAWDEIVKAYGESDRPLTGIVVAHDAINKAILASLFDLGPDYFWNFKQGNGAVSVIDYPHGPDGKPVLQTSNVTLHLNENGELFDRTAAGAL